MRRLVATGLIISGVAVSVAPAFADSSFPLDKYPGFGRSTDAALRDDTIAYWEAFQREQLIADCLAVAGFAYALDVAFPPEAVVAIAEGQGVASSATGLLADASPSARNDAYVEGLSATERDRYFQTLFAERADDIMMAEETGRIPDGRGEDFASGGCFGEAQAAIPGIWNLPRQLGDELEVMRASIDDSAELRDAKRQYAACTRESASLDADPAALEAIVAGGGPQAAAAGATLARCADIWSFGYRRAAEVAAQNFVTAHAGELAAIEAQYAGIMDTIRDDAAFRAYLSERIATDTVGEELH
jgi:hypothetical protein